MTKNFEERMNTIEQKTIMRKMQLDKRRELFEEIKKLEKEEAKIKQQINILKKQMRHNDKEFNTLYL